MADDFDFDAAGKQWYALRDSLIDLDFTKASTILADKCDIDYQVSIFFLIIFNSINQIFICCLVDHLSIYLMICIDRISIGGILDLIVCTY